MYRFRLGDSSRLEVGLEGRWLTNVQATEWALGIPAELVFEAGRHVEFTFDLVLSNTWFYGLGDAANFFPTTNAYGLRLGGGIQLAAGSHVLLGLSAGRGKWQRCSRGDRVSEDGLVARTRRLDGSMEGAALQTRTVTALHGLEVLAWPAAGARPDS